MKQFFIRTLEIDDIDALLGFEQENRTWFERHIEPRPPQFYSLEGVCAHVHELLDWHRQGRFHPCLILSGQGKILGRANLKEIDLLAGTAELGYRIGEQQTGQGLATGAVQFLIQLAASHWRLKTVFALVTQDNLASVRALEKNRFVRGEQLEKLATIDGLGLDGARFSLNLGEVFF